MVRKIFFVVLIFYTQLLLSQELTLKGVYQGQNLFIINPTINDSYCVNSVYVNDSISKDEIFSNAFEINFDLLKIDTGSVVNIKISHKEGCMPIVINSEVINPKNIFAFTSVKINKDGTLVFSISGNRGSEPFSIEQYRWGKWVKIAAVTEPDSTKPNRYTVEVKFHSGENIFRVVHTSESGNEFYSKTVKIRSQNEEVSLLSTKVTDILKFSDETLFEIFDNKGNFIRDGFGKEEDISDLPKGKYWLNFDNKTTTFTKK